MTIPNHIELATLGGGCFWCIEAIFKELKGVIKAESGYAGGKTDNPSYNEVCSGTTGHAEIVQIEFDPQIIPYQDILEIFFTIHDPTTLNRQGNDIGTQYRSIIFFHSPEQQNIAIKTFKNIEESKIWPNPLVTEIKPFTIFFRAEQYHQNYFLNNPNQSYCQSIIEPKVVKFRQKYVNKLKT